MSDNILRTITARIEKSLPDGAKEKGVLATCSGGADSTALLRALCEARIPVLVAHCNFHLRGSESMRDAAFVEDICKELDVPFITTSFNVGERCRMTGESVEMACRSLRYDWFREMMSEHGLARIAVAHNADDNVETMLLNLFRGTGLAGLTAMRVDNGEVWRPLLTTYRQEIIEFLNKLGQKYVTDSTNLTSDYRRNFIRREIIPLIETRWPAVRRSILSTREHLESVEHIYTKAISSMIQDSTFLSFDVMRKCADIRALIFEFLRPVSPSDDVLQSIVKHVTQRLDGEPHKYRLWSGDMLVSLERDGLRLSSPENNIEMPELEWVEMSPTQENIDLALSNDNPDIAYFPKKPDCYMLRFVMPGDRIRLFGGGSVKVSKAMKDAKYDSVSKSRQTVLVRRSDKCIVWAPGLRRAADDLLSGSQDTSFWQCRKK